MKKFSKEEIDGAREYFRGQGYQEVQVTLGNRNFSYFVLPHTLQPDLPNFVFRSTGAPSDGYVFGISEAVEERHRQYAVAHEFIEFTEIGIDTPDRCVGALEAVLKLVPDDIKPGYIKMRRDFFKALIDYCSKLPDQYTEEDLAEFGKTLGRLEQLVA